LIDEIQPYRHIILAFITSQVSPTPAKTDLVIEASDADFASTGLKVSSTIRPHRLMTVAKPIVRRQLGELSASHQAEINDLLRNLFDL
jgi:mRNA interferase MazF